MKEAIYNVALFASGNGTNVQRICDYFRGHSSIHPTVLVCNNPKAYVLERAEHLSLPVVIASPAQLKDPEFMLPVLRQYNITHIVLAGFLCLVPSYLVDAYPNRIVNIHPALLPKFGGKGMYGMHVHEAVAKAGESHSGITVHLVDSHYDHGTPLFQARFPIAAGEDAEAIAGRIRAAGYYVSTRRQAEQFLDRAREALLCLPDRSERALMLQMADYVRDRKK